MPGKSSQTKTSPFEIANDQSDVRFRVMFETAAVGIGMMSLERKLLDANPALCRMFGMSREELVGQTPVIVTYPEDYQASTQQFMDLLTGKQDYFWGERRYMRKNGEVFWAKVTMSLVRDKNKQPLYLLGILEDINESKKVLADLEESERRFRAAFQTSAIGMGILGLDGRILQVNDAVCKISGYDREELLQRYDQQNVFPEDADIGRDQYVNLLEGRLNNFQVEKRYVRKNGEVFWACLTLSAVRDQDGKTNYLVGMIEDITEQREALDSLRESEARFRAIFDNVSIGMAMVNLDRTVLAVNKTTERIIGFSSDELVGTNPGNLAFPEDQLIGMEAFQELIAGKLDSLQMEKRYVRKNGEVFWARITYLLVRGTDGHPQLLVGSIEDINEQRLIEEKLADQQADYLRMLEKHVEERTHELKESNLRLVSEIEQRHKAEDKLAGKAVEEAITAERTRLARDLHDAVTQTLFSASLIAEVLPDLWEIDQEEARKSNEELRQLTRGALAEMRTLLLELRPAALTQARFPDLLRQLSEAVIGRARIPVSLIVEGEYELPPEIKVAFYRITQESLNNIVKYARATQVEIKARLECCNVHIEVKDNGIGFDSSLVKPTSLGMRIMRERAEAINARLLVSSIPGQGTTVNLDWNEDEMIPIHKILTRGKS